MRLEAEPKSRIRCAICGTTREGELYMWLQHGFPVCCGQTMVLCELSDADAVMFTGGRRTWGRRYVD
jgi:putative intracellular protease/amidase